MTTPDSPTAPPRRRPAAPATGLLVAAVLLTALNLRPAVVAVAPLIDEVRADLGISASTASLLTTLPLLCFGLGSLPAAGLARRRGMFTVLLGATAVLVVGIVVRLVPSTWVLFAGCSRVYRPRHGRCRPPVRAGTVVAGLAIALGNVLVPALIKRDFTGVTVGRMLGAETVMISAGCTCRKSSSSVRCPRGHDLTTGPPSRGEPRSRRDDPLGRIGE